MFKKLPYKKILSILLLVMYVFAVFIISRIGKASADIKAFQITDAKIIEKAQTADAAITIDEDDNVKTNFTFHKVNDFIVFNLTFKNNDDKDYYIKSIIDDNTNPHVIYDYDQHKDETIKAGKTLDLDVKLTYNDEVKDLSKRDINDEVKFSFDIEDVAGNKVFGNMPTNSRSFDTIIGYIILALILIVVAVFIIIKNKKAKKVAVFLLLFVIVPLTAKAANSISFQIVLKTDVKLYDKLVMTVVNNGVEEMVVVPYGEPVEVPKEPEKKGYDFVGWYQDGEEYSFDEKLAEDVSVTAKYKVIDYDISYDYNGGLNTNNPVKYNVESKTITLTNPTKEGYSFSGWTGSNGKVYQTSVTIDQGSVGNLSFTANFSPKEDIKYTVIHRYKNLAGDGYSDEVVEELTGTTDTIVSPAAKSKTGFVNPSLKTLKITADGNASVEYIYERTMVTLAYNSDVISDTKAGSYKYGTRVTISAKEKTGYTFSRWNVNTSGLQSFVDTDNDHNISVGDSLFIGADWFYVIGIDNDQVKLLPKYNINNDARQSAIADAISYSNTIYWENSNDFKTFGYSNYLYIYRTKYNVETKNNIKTRVNAYKDYLNGLGIISVIDARLMSYEEAITLGCTQALNSCPEYIGNQPYWLGSVDIYNIFNINDNGIAANPRTTNKGVRPLIIVNKNDIIITNESSSLSTFILEANTNIIPSYTPNKDTPYKVIHKVQDIEDESVFTVAITENKTGITGDTIRVPVLNTLGSDYDTPNPTTLTINADGSSSLEYTYYYKYYNVTLDPNGGSVNTESLKVIKGNPTSLSYPINEGFEFLGWYSEAEGGTLLAEPNESYTPTRNITLYAHWESSLPQAAVIYKDLDDDGDLSVGDKVIIENDIFYFAGYDDADNYKLLPEYNLDANSRQSRYNSINVHFSDFIYWGQSASNDAGAHYSIEDFDYLETDYYNHYHLEYIYTFKYIYRTSDGQDVSDNNLTPYINNYKNYLKNTYNIKVIDARLMSYAEAGYLEGFTIDPAYNQSYWLGTAYSYSLMEYMQFDNGATTMNYNENCGIRPLIILSRATNITQGEITEKIQALLEDTNNDDKASPGDVVTIGNDEFYFVGYDGNYNYQVLSKYNLDANYRQSESNSVTVGFSTTNYWSDVAAASLSSNQPFPFTYGLRGHLNVYKNKNGTFFNQNLVMPYVINYISYLENTYEINIVDFGLLDYNTFENLGCNHYGSCPQFIASQDYWLGFVDLAAGDQPCVVTQNAGDMDYSEHYSDATSYGVRPLITISKKDVKTPWDKIATLEDTDGDNKVSYGDVVTMGSDQFYFAGFDDNGNYQLLTKYNLDANYRQSEYNSVNIAFSSDSYWNNYSLTQAPEEYPFAYYGGYEYIYKGQSGETFEENNVMPYVDNYASYLENKYSIELIDTRILRLDEVSDDCYDDLCEHGSVKYSYLYEAQFWLGSRVYYPDDARLNNSVFGVWSSNIEIREYDDDYAFGVRPLIIVSPNDVGKPWDE